MKLDYSTVNKTLEQALGVLMREELFAPFRLVGGTSLSLQLGHRISVDIDLFTDADYGLVDFKVLEDRLNSLFSFVDNPTGNMDAGIGKSFFIGADEKECVKLDLYYCDPFVDPAIEKDGVRLASVMDIAAMKLDVISRSGRKKDFWDLHALLEVASLDAVLQHYKKRYPFTADIETVFNEIRDAQSADDDFDPICLRGKSWPLIKLDLLQEIEGWSTTEFM
jgi:predicted nucleotidyltransferase component of viral defense system